jgi:hypothetical protein
VSINIRPWVFDLAKLSEDRRHNFIQLGDQLEKWILRQVLQSKLPLTCISWIGLT